MAADCGAGRRDDALVVEAEDGVHTESFLDTGGEVGQGVGFDKFGCTERIGRVFGREMRIELLLQLCIASGGSQEVVEECCQCYRAGIHTRYQLEMIRGGQVEERLSSLRRLRPSYHHG